VKRGLLLNRHRRRKMAIVNHWQEIVGIGVVFMVFMTALRASIINTNEAKRIDDILEGKELDEPDMKTATVAIHR
jgi:hypothetical protein